MDKQDHRIRPPVACVPPRESRDRSEAIRKRLSKAVARPNASVVPYARMIRKAQAGRKLFNVHRDFCHRDLCHRDFCHRDFCHRDFCHPNSTVGEIYLTYRVQATERTIRAYGTQMHRNGENYLTYRGL
jgi:hypothetical protein